MANTNYALGMLGVDFDERTTTPTHTVGTVVWCNLGDFAMYVQDSGSGIAASQTDIAVDAAGDASDGSGTWENSVAFAADEYGWVRKNAAGAIAA
jgi:hypothetical protein